MAPSFLANVVRCQTSKFSFPASTFQTMMDMESQSYKLIFPVNFPALFGKLDRFITNNKVVCADEMQQL
jgi:hypothetical protein